MEYTKVICLKDYYSPLDRTKIVHRKGRQYQAFKAKANGFYDVECEKVEGQILDRVGIQINDQDYEFG